MMNTYDFINFKLDKKNARSAWGKGVIEYAKELVDFLQENGLDPAQKNMLNGASDWSAYSYGGCSLIYDSDIAERLCNPSELKKTRNGERNPNGRETWLDVQARALRQACNIVLSAYKYEEIENI